MALTPPALAWPALYWPERRALLIADLHLEKASWLAGGGQMLPPYDSAATMAGVEKLAETVMPQEIWCLGDSFHDAHGVSRLAANIVQRIRRLTGGTRWTWITGNHDAACDAEAAALLGGAVAGEAVADGIVLRHEARRGESRPEISGHFHPKLRLSLRGRSVARRCFVRGPSKIILPAFGALAGGMDAGDPAIRTLMGTRADALVPIAKGLLSFPL